MGCKVFHGLLCDQKHNMENMLNTTMKIDSGVGVGGGYQCLFHPGLFIWEPVKHFHHHEYKQYYKLAKQNYWAKDWCENQNVCVWEFWKYSYILTGLMASVHNQLQCSTKTVFVSSHRAIQWIWRYIFKFPSRTGYSTLVPTAGKAESAHWRLQQPALNAHGVWHTPQPQLCLCWVQCSLSDPLPVRGISSKNNLLFFFFFVDSSRHSLVQPRSDSLNLSGSIWDLLIMLFPTPIVWYSSHLSWEEMTHVQMLGNSTRCWPSCCSVHVNLDVTTLFLLPPKGILISFWSAWDELCQI